MLGHVIGSLAAAAALLLVASGLAKLRTPEPTASMFVALAPGAVWRSRLLVPAARLAGAAEAAVAVSFLAWGGRGTAALLAVCWLAFTFVAVRLARGRRPVSCGCFGAAGAPVGVAHVVLDVLGLAVALAAVAAPSAAVGGLFAGTALVGFIGLAQAALLAWLGYLSITALPELLSARRLVESA